MKNQCDGCVRGLPIEDGIHVERRSVTRRQIFMACTKDRYVSTETIPGEHFAKHLAVNVDNDKLSDEAFRQMVRNTLPIVEGVEYPKKAAP